ncbi:MAG: hypothetical protein IRZ08_06810 [Frankia sp.]|nr:hypothetical protein [Frankia sp.]
MTSPRSDPRRVLVRAARGPARDLDEQTVLGDVYLRGLLRDQRRLAAGVLASLLFALGVLPLLFVLVPEIASVRVPWLHLPLHWLVLGVAVHPVLIALAMSYVRGAERTERDFTTLLSDASGRPPGEQPAPAELTGPGGAGPADGRARGGRRRWPLPALRGATTRGRAGR